VVHPIDAKIFTSKSRTVKVIASTWLVAVVLALPYLYCKSYAFSIESHLGSASRFICTDRFDEIDAMMYGHAWQKSSVDYDEGLQLQSPLIIKHEGSRISTFPIAHRHTRHRICRARHGRKNVFTHFYSRHVFTFLAFLVNVNSRSRSLYAVARPSVVCLSVTLVHRTHAVQIFGNISTALGTLAIH